MEETYRDKPKKAEKWENGRQTEKVRKCPKNKEKPRKSEISKELKIYDSSTFHLPRQCLMQAVKALILLDFLEINQKFTPYLYLWKTGLVIKTYRNYKEYVLKIRN